MYPSDRGKLQSNNIMSMFKDISNLSSFKPDDIINSFNTPSINDIMSMTEDYTGISQDSVNSISSDIGSNIDKLEPMLSQPIQIPEFDFSEDDSSYDMIPKLIDDFSKMPGAENNSIITGITSLDSIDARSASQLDELIDRNVDKVIAATIGKANDWLEGIGNDIGGQINSLLNQSKDQTYTSSFNKERVTKDFYKESSFNSSLFNDNTKSVINPSSFNYDSELTLDVLKKYANPDTKHDTNSYIMSGLLSFSDSLMVPNNLDSKGYANGIDNMSAMNMHFSINNMTEALTAIKNLGPTINTEISNSTLASTLLNIPTVMVQNMSQPFISSITKSIDSQSKRR